ncbi:hypothetical protein M3Y99_01147200 [Aphelenchoides fujianensis]|nr:hypothetical protein M3Y99_01147200 [Aphelenchoides fujianensis]
MTMKNDQRANNQRIQKDKLAESAYHKDLANYRDNLLVEAEEIVRNGFPASVLRFNELLNSSEFSHDRLTDLLPDVNSIVPMPKQVDGAQEMEVDPPKKMRPAGGVTSTPVYVFSGGVVKSNDKLAEMTSTARSLLRNTVEEINKVKMFLTFLIPKIEDGNNFGVQIQEEVLNEVRTVESEAATFYEQMSRYFLSRAELIVKAAKYPHVEDYRRAIIDTDEKQFINLRIVLMETRNHLATVHDLVMKNWEKIKKPRSSHIDQMY